MRIRSVAAAAATIAVAGACVVVCSESAQALPRSDNCKAALVEYYYDLAMYDIFDGRTTVDIEQGNFPQAENDADATTIWAQRRDTMQTRLLNAGCF
jgi:hypothetical protein